MRTANFRDDVLWAVAYKKGLTPDVDFLSDQAASIVSSINSWVRRLYDAVDWPEWTVIGRFSPQTAPTLQHIVSWNQPPISYIRPPLDYASPDQPAPGPADPLIGKVLRLYLVDPRTTWTPVDAPFRLTDHGVHCGFDHGSSVWLKFIPRTPKFTANEWDTDVTYKKDALVYSPVSGECYISKSNNNRGHDPTETAQSEQQTGLPTEIIQEFEHGNPGLSATNEIVEIVAASGVATNGAGVLTDPAPNGQIFTIEVNDGLGTSLGTATTTGNGVLVLDYLFSVLRDQLAAALTGFTVTKLTAPTRIRIEHSSGFKVGQATYTSGPIAVFPLVVQQLQTYSAAISPTAPVAKQIRLDIGQSQVLPGETYTLTFTGLDGVEHPVSYVSAAADDALQILSGLADALIASQSGDPFFTKIQSSLDTVSPSLTFSVDPTIARASLDSVVTVPASIYWSYIPFPLALVDQVVRGAYADSLKEEGQPDKGGPEEAQVPNEQTIRSAAYASKQFDGLTDQQIQRSRYAKQ